ncbi:MAG TPA: DUF4255 domain-containing protein [Steroidobacteraceae bacterium]|nr:DUF4255 domain-containing protein [Steroidobacteraceae bacterium]
MAGLSAINAVTAGLAQYLTRAHQLSPIKSTSCTFTATGTSELRQLDGEDTTVSLFIYRVAPNEHTRNGIGRVDPRRPAMTVNLHGLLTVWADSAQKEQLVFAWVLRELARLALLDRGLLGAAANFDASDLVQVTIEDLSLDDVSKLWQMLAPPYRLSAGFVARNVRIDYDDDESFAPVVATRFGVADVPEGA